MIQNEIEKIIGNKYGNSYETKLKLLEVLFLAEELLKKYNVETTEIVLRDHYGAKGKCNNGYKISLQINFIMLNSCFWYSEKFFSFFRIVHIIYSKFKRIKFSKNYKH